MGDISTESYSTSDIARALGEHFGCILLTPKLNLYLADNNIIFKDDNLAAWVLCPKYQESGYAFLASGVNTLGNSYKYLRWTEKGLEFLVNLVNKRPIFAT